MEISARTRIEEQVFARIEQQQSQLVARLQDLIAFQTVTPQDNQPVEISDYEDLIEYAADLLRKLGAAKVDIWEQDASELEAFPGSGVNHARDLSRMPVLVATLPGGGEGRSLLLNGHYDVVPAGEPGEWTHAPFVGKVVGDKIFGRGSCDMKGGIAAMLTALQTLSEMGIRLSGDVIVEVVPDEEMSCMGTMACCQRGYRADAALIPEPTNMQVLIALRGSFYGEITVRGRAGHAEMTQPDWQQGGAVNAIDKAQIVLAALNELNQIWGEKPRTDHPLLDADKVVATHISGGGEWAVTYPDKVTIGFGVMSALPAEEVRQELESFVNTRASLDSWLEANPPEFEYEPVWHYGAETDQDEPIAKLGLEVLEQFGYEPQVRGMGSLTDAIHLINYANIPTISIGPADQPAHMVDEYVEIHELTILTKMIALVLLRWCGFEEEAEDD